MSLDDKNNKYLDPTEISLGIIEYLNTNNDKNNYNIDDNGTTSSTTVNDSSNTSTGSNSTRHDGFTAISKGRFSDFVVREVAIDQCTVAILNCMDPIIITDTVLPKDEEKLVNKEKEKNVAIASTTIPTESISQQRQQHERDDKRKHDQVDDTTTINNNNDNSDTTTVININPDWRIKIQEELVQLLTEHSVNDSKTKLEVTVATSTTNTVLDFILSPPKPFESSSDNSCKQTSVDATTTTTGSKDDTTSSSNDGSGIWYVLLPPVPEKTSRTIVHNWIRQRLSNVMDGTIGADTAVSTVVGHQIRIWHPSYRNKMPNMFDNRRQNSNNNNNKKQKLNHTDSQQQQHQQQKKYIRFVLYKENIDTTQALQLINRNLRFINGGGGPNGDRGRGRGRGRGRHNNNNNSVRLGFAGNKDKRGITSQFITFPSSRNNDNIMRTLCRSFNENRNNNSNRNRTNNNNSDNNTTGKNSNNTNNSNTNNPSRYGSGHTTSEGGSIVRVGNFTYTDDELRLGRLYGNRFEIVLRNVQIANGNNQTDYSNTVRSVLSTAVGSVRTNGFINYFGTQRFGKYHDTHLTGIAVLKGDYELAINNIMTPKANEYDSIRTIRQKWLDRFNTTPLTVKSEGTTNSAATITTTTVDGTATTPIVINEDSSETVRRQRSTMEQKCARDILKELNPRFMVSETSILHTLANHPLQYQRAFLSITKTMKMMFVHAVQSYIWNHMASYRIAKYGIENVIEGELVLLEPTMNEKVLPDVHIVTADDVINKKYTIQDVVLPLLGSKTLEPQYVEWTIAVAELLDRHGINRDMFTNLQKIDRDFHIVGDYRRLICCPNTVDWDVIEYDNPLQPLLQTDYMKVQNIDVVTKLMSTTTKVNQQEVSDRSQVASSTGPATSNSDGVTGEQKDDTSENEIKPPVGSISTQNVASTMIDPIVNDQQNLTAKKPLIALRISFTLPSSSYATIFLRELMKRPTSSEYQSQLNFG